MLLPQIYTVTAPWASPTPVTATELEQTSLGVVYASSYAEHHPHIGGMPGIAFEGLRSRLRRWLQGSPILQPQG